MKRKAVEKGGKLGKGPHIRVCTLSILDSIKIIVIFEITQILILPKTNSTFFVLLSHSTHLTMLISTMIDSPILRKSVTRT